MIVPVDAHVHVHPGWDRDDLLDAARANMAPFVGGAAPVTGVLVLAEMAGRDAFARWTAQAADASAPGRWRLSRTGEDAALIARGPEGAAVALVAGRQVRSREGLEVLAQGTTAHLPDGASFADTLARALEVAPLVSAPWALGKWWGSRGRTVARLVTSAAGEGVLLADNGLRPRWSARPPLIRAAVADGRPVLAGSDPLPLAGQLERVGSFGVILAGPLDLDRPIEWLIHRLGGDSMPLPYGRGRSLRAFLSDQLGLRIKARHPQP